MAEDSGTPAKGDSRNKARDDHWIVAIVKALLASRFGRLLIVLFIGYYLFAIFAPAFLPFKTLWFGWFPTVSFAPASGTSTLPAVVPSNPPSKGLAPVAPDPCLGPKDDRPISCRG
jgi:hypothetical protein